MKTSRRYLAAAELLLIFPATLFMSALFVRNLQPQQYEPARTAERIVEIYAHSTHIGLWLLMMALPFIVLVVGSVSLLRSWCTEPDLREAARQAAAALRAYFASFIIACATIVSLSILAIVVLHVITD
jgi:cytochrome b561